MRSLERFERAIGVVLISGVVISLFLEVIGIVLFYGTYGHLSISDNRLSFVHGKNFFTFVSGAVSGRDQKPILFMTLGIVILMLTPYVRVVMSVFYFAWERNTKYVIITLFVLVLLTFSMIGK